MIELSYDEFEGLVAEALNQLPDKFRELMANVAVTIVDQATVEQLKRQHIGNPLSLFGLYEGVPQSQRGLGYSGVLPDRISIFKKSIENSAVSPDDVRKMVSDTVWHEVAHHFGMDERTVRKAEARRRKLPASPNA